MVFRTGSPPPSCPRESKRLGWNRIYEGEHLIALEKDGASITLEPGGQFELSGGPMRTVAEVVAMYGNTVIDAQHVGQARGRRRSAHGAATDPRSPRPGLRAAAAGNQEDCSSIGP